MIGLIMFVFGSLVFSGLVYNLRAQGPLIEWDRALANTLPAMALRSPVYVKGIMTAGYYIGYRVIIGLGILLGLYFIIIKRALHCFSHFLWAAGVLVGPENAICLLESGRGCGGTAHHRFCWL